MRIFGFRQLLIFEVGKSANWLNNRLLSPKKYLKETADNRRWEGRRNVAATYDTFLEVPCWLADTSGTLDAEETNA